ncbi:hypothetical protein [Cryobacterium sp. TMT4-31]|uniref:hypothetical protein n=1 Tax=Cryobacterium sp. TMT4-31 TaxID=1259259 RepID=UPI00106BBC35|nr:hypothetical protein [Cryobacterium sp. TMT4-31]TFC92321.1 hypothetical protein E3T19_02430 [Cryobacterium sp. TMT4-31]
MDGILVQILITAFGTFLGAALALMSASWFRSRDEQRNEDSIVNSVIIFLSARRALVVSDPRILQSVDTADWNGDYARAGRSVGMMRDEILRASALVTPSSKCSGPLQRMVMSCNLYMEKSANRPVNYWIDLNELRLALTVDVQRLQAANPRLSDVLPGAAAFAAA